MNLSDEKCQSNAEEESKKKIFENLVDFWNANTFLPSIFEAWPMFSVRCLSSLYVFCRE